MPSLPQWALPQLVLVTECGIDLLLRCPLAVIAGDDVGRDQRQDDLRLLEMLVDLPGPLLARLETPIVPGAEQPLPAEEREMGLELLA